MSFNAFWKVSGHSQGLVVLNAFSTHLRWKVKHDSIVSLEGIYWLFFIIVFIIAFPIKYFVGNYDGESIVTRTLTPPIVARYVRVHPRGWYRHISMRLELHGCTPGEKHYVHKPTHNSNNWFNLFTPKISLVILHTVSHIFLIILFQRI